MTRQIILDTETTGLDPKDGHRLIEVGCVEMVERCLTGNNFHMYLQPDRDIDAEAEAVHGISSAFLADKPRFADIAEDLIAYLEGATDYSQCTFRLGLFGSRTWAARRSF